MTAVELLRVTFDTNVCNFISDPTKPGSPVAPAAVAAVRAAVSDGRVRGFISEASLFVECLSFPEKLAYLAAAGTSVPRPAPDPRTVAMFQELASLGMKLLHAPLIGAEIFITGIAWADDERFPIDERQTRFFSFIEPLPRHKPLVAYGKSLSPAATGGQRSPVPTKNGFSMPICQEWAARIKQAWDTNPAGRKQLEKAVRPDIGEWCDGLIVGSHYGYGNDVFCTLDKGKNAGSSSLLHMSNRSALEARGIKLMTLEELVLRYGL